MSEEKKDSVWFIDSYAWSVGAAALVIGLTLGASIQAGIPSSKVKELEAKVKAADERAIASEQIQGVLDLQTRQIDHVERLVLKMQYDQDKDLKMRETGWTYPLLCKTATPPADAGEH
jgi:hypothetical protein